MAMANAELVNGAARSQQILYIFQRVCTDGLTIAVKTRSMPFALAQ